MKNEFHYRNKVQNTCNSITSSIQSFNSSNFMDTCYITLGKSSFIIIPNQGFFFFEEKIWQINYYLEMETFIKRCHCRDEDTWKNNKNKNTMSENIASRTSHPLRLGTKELSWAIYKAMEEMIYNFI